MVDGVDIGNEVQFVTPGKGKGSLTGVICKHQDFRNADMVVIQTPPVSDSNGEGNKGYQVYGVFGQRVVSSYAKESTISSYSGVWKDKMVFARTKPYILNGD